jgi:hypothetical protein
MTVALQSCSFPVLDKNVALNGLDFTVCGINIFSE